MAGTYYKYAERDADSQINWAEVGKGLSDMLSETNKVREDKKAALDTAQRDTMAYLAQTPNGEDKSARAAALEYADQAANRMRIAKQQMEQGQISVKDYTIFRQNLTDNTNLLFNANKAYQDVYATKMQRNRDGISSALEVDRMKDAEMFGDWANTGFYIGPDGVVMAGKLTEQDVDGKKVKTLDKTPGNLRNIDTINQLLVGEIDKYDYKTPIKNFVDNLGEEKQATAILGKIQQQGKILTVEDITSRTDLLPGTKDILYKFLNAENDKIREIAGNDLQRASILMDSAILAPNNKPYTLTSDPKEAAKGVNFILKEYDPNTRGVVYKISDAQNKDVERFIRNNMRSQYDYKEEVQVVGAVSRDEESQDAIKAREEKKEKDNALGTWGDVFKATTPQAKKAAIETILGSQLSQSRGLLDIDTSVNGKVTFKYSDPVRNRTLNYDPTTITLRQWNELGNEIHGIDNVADVMKRNKGGDPNMKMGPSQRNFSGVRAGRTAVKDPDIEFSNKVASIKTNNLAYLKDKEASAKLGQIIKGTGITIVPNSRFNPNNAVTLKSGDKEFVFEVGYGSNEKDDAETAMSNVIEWIEKNTSAEAKKVILSKGSGRASQY